MLPTFLLTLLGADTVGVAAAALVVIEDENADAEESA